ncbi:MAG TPA: Gmad2 immunoglobulin-like domain-containing protein [Acidimicrobiales bacterium]|nr:Gmad2 immunoglobulin-like domain-containing protein [Acidimicrobiales bacterium]
MAMVSLVACRGDRGEDATSTTSSNGPSTTASSTTSTAPVPDGGFRGIWPFTSRAEVDAYAAGTDRVYRDPSATALRFASQYLGMTEPASFDVTGTGAAREVGVGPRAGEGGRAQPDPTATTILALEQLGPQGDSGPWSVVGARSPKIELESPAARSTISSPSVLVGRANVFEGTVTVRMKEDGMTQNQTLGQGFVTGSGDSSGELGPFRGEVTFRRPTKPGGAIVLSEDSAVEGQGVLRATVIRVFFTR